jgi:hypothetical protein
MNGEAPARNYYARTIGAELAAWIVALRREKIK